VVQKSRWDLFKRTLNIDDLPWYAEPGFTDDILFDGTLRSALSLGLRRELAQGPEIGENPYEQPDGVDDVNRAYGAVEVDINDPNSVINDGIQVESLFASQDGIELRHRFTQPGDYIMILTMRDDQGNISQQVSSFNIEIEFSDGGGT
jgi:hypothetical protein